MVSLILVALMAQTSPSGDRVDISSAAPAYPIELRQPISAYLQCLNPPHRTLQGDIAQQFEADIERCAASRVAGEIDAIAQLRTAQDLLEITAFVRDAFQRQADGHVARGRQLAAVMAQANRTTASTSDDQPDAPNN